MPDNSHILYLPAENTSVAQGAVAALGRWDQRNAGHHNEKRGSERHQYNAQVVIAVNSHGVRTSQDQPSDICVATWGRNLSATGISILASGVIVPVGHHAEDMPILDIDKLIRQGDRCHCGLVQSTSSLLWIEGEVVRIRNADEKMKEIGIHFLRKK